MRKAEVLGQGTVGSRRNAIAAALATILVAVAATLWAAGHALAATYKWVDEKGVVHYTDKLPPDAVDKASATARNKRIGRYPAATLAKIGLPVGLQVGGSLGRRPYRGKHLKE